MSWFEVLKNTPQQIAEYLKDELIRLGTGEVRVLSSANLLYDYRNKTPQVKNGQVILPMKLTKNPQERIKQLKEVFESLKKYGIETKLKSGEPVIPTTKTGKETRLTKLPPIVFTFNAPRSTVPLPPDVPPMMDLPPYQPNLPPIPPVPRNP